MAHIPPTTDPDTSIRWRPPPAPNFIRHRHRDDSSIPKYQYPSHYYYPTYLPLPPPHPKGYNASYARGDSSIPKYSYPSDYYHPSYSPPPPKGYSTSYAPQQAQTSIPGPGYPPPPPQPYWHQNWPHSSLTPAAYPVQPPTLPVDYPQAPPPPPPPPPSASKNHPVPSNPNQQAALTLYINPALLTLTPTPVYSRPVSPQPGHPTPYNDVDQPPQRRHVNPRKKARSPPQQPQSQQSTRSRVLPFRAPTYSHGPSSLTPPRKRASDPAAPVPVRSSSTTSSASSPIIPIRRSYSPRSPIVVVSRPLSPPISFPPRVDSPFSPPERNTGVSTSVRPLSSDSHSLPRSPSVNPTRWNRVAVAPAAYPHRRVDDIRVEGIEFEAKKIGQIVNRDKLDQALKSADPKLKVLEDFVDLPKLLELLNLGAYDLPGDQSYEDATVKENNAGQSSTREHAEGAPGEVILPRTSSPNEDDDMEDRDSRGGSRMGSVRGTSVVHVVPQIPPSPLEYSIKLVRMGNIIVHDDEESDLDNYDTTNSLDHDRYPRHSLSGESRSKSKSEDEIQSHVRRPRTLVPLREERVRESYVVYS